MINCAIGTNELRHDQRGIICKVSFGGRWGFVKTPVLVTHLVIKMECTADAMVACRYDEKGKLIQGSIHHPLIYRQFSREDCKEFKVDFGGWLSS